jgi:hypothetical protein
MKTKHDPWKPVSSSVGLLVLVWSYTAACCVSLVCAAYLEPVFHILYQTEGFLNPIAVVAAFGFLGLLFAVADFSFGYLIGFCFYGMVAGYLWENFFSDFSYNHQLSGLSAAASAVAFLMPVLFISSPIRPIVTLSSAALGRLLMLFLLLAFVTIAWGSTYGLRFVPMEDIYKFREEIVFPALLSYLIGITSGALLPFAFACYVARRDAWRAGAILLVLTLYYPITLSKIALFTPAWLILVTLLSRVFETRKAVILSLLAPLIIGLILFALFKDNLLPGKIALTYFGTVNFRTIAIPSIALDFYTDFFFKHDPTYFCQIRIIKPFVSCPYEQPVSKLIFEAYGIGGNFNASLFATEGIASVGVLFAPIPVFFCGLIIALGNRVSAGLPPRFIFMSAAIFPHILLNVPLTITLLTHGGLFLFLLWYVTPRAMFDQYQSVQAYERRPAPRAEGAAA